LQLGNAGAALGHLSGCDGVVVVPTAGYASSDADQALSDWCDAMYGLTGQNYPDHKLLVGVGGSHHDDVRGSHHDDAGGSHHDDASATGVCGVSDVYDVSGASGVSASVIVGLNASVRVSGCASPDASANAAAVQPCAAVVATVS